MVLKRSTSFFFQLRKFSLIMKWTYIQIKCICCNLCDSWFFQAFYIIFIKGFIISTIANCFSWSRADCLLSFSWSIGLFSNDIDGSQFHKTWFTKLQCFLWFQNLWFIASIIPYLTMWSSNFSFGATSVNIVLVQLSLSTFLR